MRPRMRAGEKRPRAACREKGGPRQLYLALVCPCSPQRLEGGTSHRSTEPQIPAWLRPKQTDMVPGKGQYRSRFLHIRSGTVVRQRFFGIAATDTDIIAAQHFWTGRLETAGPGCDDAVAIARTVGFRMLVMSPHPSCGDCPLPARRVFPNRLSYGCPDNDFAGSPQPTPTSSQRNTSGRAVGDVRCAAGMRGAMRYSAT